MFDPRLKKVLHRLVGQVREDQLAGLVLTFHDGRVGRWDSGIQAFVDSSGKELEGLTPDQISDVRWATDDESWDAAAPAEETGSTPTAPDGGDLADVGGALSPEAEEPEADSGIMDL